ncbi:MAG: tRNA dimethylallyltransferase [Hyphomicrobiaceae bacterium hypho_1]
MKKNKTILITGPTASGKSQLAIDIAMMINGTIINADSMQVYESLNILTARPQLAELAMAPHQLYGYVAGEEAYSVGRYIDDARTAIAKCNEAGRIPIVVGGSGLYFKALLNGLSPVPQIPLHIRNYWRSKGDRIASQELHDILRKRDWKMAQRLQSRDRQRILRALEVLDATGKSLDDWQRIPGVPVISCVSAVRVVLNPDRAIVDHNCKVRLEGMIANGALDEVAILKAKNLSKEMPIMRALGVQPLLAHLQNQINLVDAIEATKTETSRYIKRQLTWFRGNMSAWNWISEQEVKLLKENIIQIVR